MLLALRSLFFSLLFIIQQTTNTYNCNDRKCSGQIVFSLLSGKCVLCVCVWSTQVFLTSSASGAEHGLLDKTTDSTVVYWFESSMDQRYNLCVLEPNQQKATLSAEFINISIFLVDYFFLVEESTVFSGRKPVQSQGNHVNITQKVTSWTAHWLRRRTFSPKVAGSRHNKNFGFKSKK